MCKPLYYGGCGGNKNNFRTMTDCHKACKGPCNNVVIINNNNNNKYKIIIIIINIK